LVGLEELRLAKPPYKSAGYAAAVESSRITRREAFTKDALNGKCLPQQKHLVKVMVNHKHRFAFIHIPKCGGTSIECLFLPTAGKQNVPNKHATLSALLGKCPNIQHYFKFAFVRNPWDLTVSMYTYLWLSEYVWPVTWRQQYKDFAKLSFREWVKHPYFQTPTIRSVNVAMPGGADGEYSDWIQSAETRVDFVGRFESLQQDFDSICDTIKIRRMRLPHVNKTDRMHYSSYYDDETRSIVAEKYARDIELFGYEFGD
jgi:hypothetical protein